MANRYNREYEQYYIYALEQFLIKTYGYSEHDAKVKVMQDFDEVKEDYEIKEIKWICKLLCFRENVICAPCSKTGVNLGAGGYNAMRGHGGFTATVIEEGEIKLGDTIELI